MSKKQKRILVICLLCAVVILAVVLLRSCDTPTESQEQKRASSTADNSLDYTPYIDDSKNQITIPAVNGFNFTSNSLTQTVDLYNPESNNCYFVISLLLSDSTELFKSDYLKPGETLDTITLNQTLQRGLYKNCRLVYSCYTLDNKSPLNSGNIKLEINVQ